MKRLLTFIYGLIMISFGFACWYGYTKIDSWDKWLSFGAFILFILDGFTKLNKAIK